MNRKSCKLIGLFRKKYSLKCIGIKVTLVCLINFNNDRFIIHSFLHPRWVKRDDRVWWVFLKSLLIFASDWQLLIFLILVLTAAPSPWPDAGWGQGEVFLISAPRPQARLLHSHQHSHPPPDLRGRSETGPDSEEEWWSLKNTKHRIKNMFSKQSRKTRRLKRILWLPIQNIFRRILKTCFQMVP